MTDSDLGRELPRNDWEAYCKECGLAFGLVDDSPIRTCCRTCYEALGCPAVACDECGKVIPPGEKFHLGWFDGCGHVISSSRHVIRPGEKFHLGWSRLCRQCARRLELDFGTEVPCDTRAWAAQRSFI